MKRVAAKERLDIEIQDSPDSQKKALYLKDKADEFFKKGNVISAINAYTEAYRHDPTLTG
jgi:hypothetical protein